MSKHDNDTPLGVEVETVTRRRRRAIKEKNPVPMLIRKYLDQEIEFVHELAELQYLIRAQRIRPGGQKVTIQGKIFDSLETIGNDLGELYGSSRWKLFVTALNDQGEKVAFVVIPDFAIEWAGEEEPAEPDEDTTRDRHDELMLELKKIEMKQAHEKELKQMELNGQLMIAIANAKGGGGMTPASVMNIIKMGIALGQGKDLETDGEQPGGDNMLELMKTPLAQALAIKLLGGSAQPAESTVAPAPVTQEKEPGP